MKKIISFVTSMFFGMICLGFIAIFGIIAAYIPQGQPMEFYNSNYSNFIYNVISTLQLYKAYTSPIFIFFVACLTLNLAYCIIRRTSNIVKLLKGELTFKPKGLILTLDNRERTEEFISEFKGKKDITAYQISLNVNNLRSIGSWLTHIGLLIIILGFSYGNIFGKVTFVQGVPGDRLEFPFEDGVLEIVDYDIGYREDYSIAYYKSDVKIIDSEGHEETGEVLVNEPFRYKGYSIYQVGTGWSVEIGDSENFLRLYPGEGVNDSSHNYSIYLDEFFPDYILYEKEPQTLTPFLSNPMAVYTLYQGETPIERGARPIGEPFNLGTDELVFQEPELYTRLQISQAPDNILALIGGAILMLGLAIAFFYSPTVLLAREEDGQWNIYGENRANYYQLENKVKEYKEEGQ